MISNKSYEVLHQKHQVQLDKARRLLKEKQEKEMEQCTFTPKLIQKSSTAKKLASLQEAELQQSNQRTSPVYR